MDKLELNNSKSATCTMELDNSIFDALKLDNSRFRSFDNMIRIIISVDIISIISTYHLIISNGQLMIIYRTLR